MRTVVQSVAHPHDLRLRHVDIGSIGLTSATEVLRVLPSNTSEEESFTEDRDAHWPPTNQKLVATQGPGGLGLDVELAGDLVYARKSFVATEEGQVNVISGESLFLYDGSDPYWWLVRVQASQKIGYLPALNIEFPLDRFARINSVQNTELASPVAEKKISFAPTVVEYNPPLWDTADEEVAPWNSNHTENWPSDDSLVPLDELALFRKRLTSLKDDAGFPEGPPEPSKLSNKLTLKVYQNLFLLLMQELTSSRRISNGSLSKALQGYCRRFSMLDTSSSVVESQACRTYLLSISSYLHISEHQVHQALELDEVELSKLFQSVVCEDSFKHAVLNLRGDEAQDYLDFIQKSLDIGSLDEVSTLRAHRLLVKLSGLCDRLPSSLSVRGVTLLSRDAVSGGGFADIYRASHKGGPVALKRLRVFESDLQRGVIHRMLRREALVWLNLKHPNVLPLFGVDAETFPSFLCLVSPWMQHGTILQYLTTVGLSHLDLDKFLLEVAQGLQYLHSRDIVHGDLRGGNILVNDGGHACLADFGLTVFADATVATHTSNHVGSTRWMAPELHDPESFGLERFQRTRASDMYAFACVCLEVYTGLRPFFDVIHESAVMLQVIKGIRPKRPSGGPGRAMSADLWALVGRCWAQNHADRLNIHNVVEIMLELNMGSS